MSFEIVGKLYKKFDTEQKTDSFRAREFVILTGEGQYPQYIKFQLTQDRCELIDPFEAEDSIRVYFDLRGREWNEKFFTNLNAWRVTKEEAGPGNDSPEENSAPFPQSSEAPDGDFDDLPF